MTWEKYKLYHKESFKQLPLSIALRDDCTLEGFYPGSNQEALAMLNAMTQGQGEQFVFLWGREGVGKSHLLQGACHSASKRLSSVYIPLGTWLQEQSPEALNGLERVEFICIDDIQLATTRVWQEALFHLYNRLRTLNHRLVVAAPNPPKMLDLELADLKSRLSWGVTYQIHPLDDEQLIAALQLRAKQRGLDLSHEVGVFLIRRYARSMPKLYNLLDSLDKASLAAQRRLTIPFIKSILSL